MTTFQITTFTGLINNQSTQLINARELHQKLENGKQFSDWIQHRISKYKFSENLDFIVVHQLVSVDRGFFGMRQENIKEYHITLDMAKELCMLERSELGQQARRYFIQMEKHALQEIPRLQAENAELKQQLGQIPHFMRDPDLHLKLLVQAQNALFTVYPECEKIILYRDMGLENREICKLLDLGRKALETRLRKLFDLGLLQRKSPSQPQSKQLALGLVA